MMALDGEHAGSRTALRQATSPSERPILVVEDNSGVRLTILTALMDAGYPVMAAPDGAAALERLQHVPARLIVLDLGLPVLNGQEFMDVYRHTGHPAPV